MARAAPGLNFAERPLTQLPQSSPCWRKAPGLDIEGQPQARIPQGSLCRTGTKARPKPPATRLPTVGYSPSGASLGTSEIFYVALFTSVGHWGVGGPCGVHGWSYTRSPCCFPYASSRTARSTATIVFAAFAWHTRTRYSRLGSHESISRLRHTAYAVSTQWPTCRMCSGERIQARISCLLFAPSPGP